MDCIQKIFELSFHLLKCEMDNNKNIDRVYGFDVNVPCVNEASIQSNTHFKSPLCRIHNNAHGIQYTIHIRLKPEIRNLIHRKWNLVILN